MSSETTSFEHSSILSEVGEFDVSWTEGVVFRKIYLGLEVAILYRKQLRGLIEVRWSRLNGRLSVLTPVQDSAFITGVPLIRLCRSYKV